MAQKPNAAAAALGLALSAAVMISVWVATRPDPSPIPEALCDAECAAPASVPVIGASVDRGSLHLITRPGRYGLGHPPGGSRYAVLDGQIVRVSVTDGQLLSILRRTERILD